MEKEPQQEQQSGYYGTGRRPKAEKSQLPLIVTLVVAVLIINLTSVAIRIDRKRDESAHASTAEETSGVDAVSLAPGEVRSTNLPQENVTFGVSVSALEEGQRRYWNLPKGVMVDEVAPECSAYLAGIRQGDIVLSIEGAEVTAPEEYCAAMQRLQTGDTAKVVLYRSGSKIEIELILHEQP